MVGGTGGLGLRRLRWLAEGEHRRFESGVRVCLEFVSS